MDISYSDKERQWIDKNGYRGIYFAKYYGGWGGGPNGYWGEK